MTIKLICVCRYIINSHLHIGFIPAMEGWLALENY